MSAGSFAPTLSKRSGAFDQIPYRSEMTRCAKKGDTARTQGADRICRQAAGNCERVIVGTGLPVDSSA
jgi:hypothetical protein